MSTAKGKVEWRPSAFPGAWLAEVGRLTLFVYRANPRSRWYWSASLDGRRIGYGQPGDTLRHCQLAAERWAQPST